MAINPNSIAVPQQAKALDTTTVTTAQGVVHRQIISIADPENAGQYARLNGSSLQTHVTNTVNISAASMPLPSGAAVEAKQPDFGVAGTPSADVVTVQGIAGGDAVAVDTGADIKAINTAIVGTDQAIVTNTVIHGLSTGGGGGYIDVKVTPSGAVVTDTGLTQPLTDAQLRATGQQVATRPYGIDVSRGLVAGITTRTITGYNAATTTTQEPVWAQSGATYPWPTAVQTITVGSTSAADTAAGTGAQQVLVRYIDFTTRAEVVATVALNGITPVTVTTNGYRINEFRAVVHGTGGANAGTVFAGYGAFNAVTGHASILSSIPVGKNKAQQSIFTVPAGVVAELVSFRFTVSAASVIQLRLKTQTGTGFAVEFDQPFVGANSFESVFPTPVSAGTDIEFRAAGIAGATQVGVIYSCYLRTL